MEEKQHFLNTYYSPSTLLDILFLIQKWQILASILSLPIQGRSLWSILPFSNNMDHQKVLVKVALQEAIAFQSLRSNRLNETICHPLMNSESIHKGHVGVLSGWTNILAQRIFLFFSLRLVDLSVIMVLTVLHQFPWITPPYLHRTPGQGNWNSVNKVLKFEGHHIIK